LNHHNQILIISRAEDAKGLGSKPTLELDGQDYVLKTDSNHSETTIDSMSVVSELVLLAGKLRTDLLGPRPRFRRRRCRASPRSHSYTFPRHQQHDPTQGKIIPIFGK
jgi:hypothetical protein